jgi:mRNA interferase RelE/StbE
MGSYKVILKPSVEKDFRKLSKTILLRILSAIDNLATEPFPPKAANSKEQIKHIEFGSAIIGSFYEVETKRNSITILYVRHRREVYRNL